MLGYTVCPSNSYGPSCARCRKWYQSCDSITGRYTQCPPSFYGEECQYSCPLHCLDLNCDHTTGSCNGCKDGYHGQHCQLELTTAVLTSGYNYEKKHWLYKVIETSAICWTSKSRGGGEGSAWKILASI